MITKLRPIQYNRITAQRLAAALSSPRARITVLAKWVVSEDADLRELRTGVMAVPAAWLVGGA